MARDDLGLEGGVGRVREPARNAGKEDHAVKFQQRRRALLQREPYQYQRAQARGGARGQKDGLAAVMVGDIAAEEDQGDRGDGFHQPQPAQRHGAVREAVDLKADDDGQSAAAERERAHGRDEQPDVIDLQSVREMMGFGGVVHIRGIVIAHGARFTNAGDCDPLVPCGKVPGAWRGENNRALNMFPLDIMDRVIVRLFRLFIVKLH